MTERLSTTTTEAPHVDDDTIAEIDALENNLPPEEVDPSVARLQEAREHVQQLLDEYDTRKKVRDQEAALATYETPFVPEPTDGESAEKSTDDTSGEAENDSVADDPESSTATDAETAASPENNDEEDKPEKKSRERTRKFFRKIGKWAVTSLEANGWIPRRGTWHKRDGVAGFIAKTYVWSKKRKADRTDGFLSAEASQEINGKEADEPEDSHESGESSGEDHEDETKVKQVRRRLGRIALTLARRAGNVPKKAYRTWKEIKNVHN